MKSGNNEGKWEVDFGIDETGTRRRPTFHNEDAASAAVDTWKRELKAYGEFWALLPALERKTVAVIYQAIKARGLTITKVWEDYQRLSKDDKQMPITNMHYEGAVAEWKRRKLAAGKSERYVEEAAALLLKFGEGRARQNIHEFQPSELDAWIDGHKAWGLSSKKTNMSLFSSLWEVAKAKGWASLQHRGPPGTNHQARADCRNLQQRNHAEPHGRCAGKQADPAGRRSACPRPVGMHAPGRIGA